jgi:hypothetical protein
MSKCQRNKYFLGTPVEKKCNPEFQSSMAKLLSDREKQDLQFSSPLHSHSQNSQQIVVKPNQTNSRISERHE